MRTTKYPVNRLALTLAAALFAATPALFAQDTSAIPPTPPNTASPTAPTATPDVSAPAQASATLTTPTGKKKKVDKDDRVQQTKDTKKEVKKEDKYNALLGKDETLPDKQLYDKALAQEKSGHFDIARLDLQTLLNTYPDSEYQMRAKLAVADCWYREGGSAALAQAEQEYKDFITFFPNAPEAAEAQMRVGDIYFKQMDVPDRDYTKALHAEEEYRTMLKQYPDAPKDIITQATQKLREVQEMLATREALNAAFYATHENWAATIARYQTVVDLYPQYSHMDDALIGLGDTYEQEARLVRAQPTCPPTPSPVPCLPEAAKAKLETTFDGKAAAAYRKVVLEHCAAPHVEDAKERLVGMSLDVPTPTKEQCAASETLENSRAGYTISNRLELLILHKPDTVTAARTGAPTLDDPPTTVAPTVVKEIQEAYMAAAFTDANRPAGAPLPAVAPGAPAAETPADTPPPPSGAAPSLSDIPAAGQGSAGDATGTMTETTPAATGSGNHLGVEVLTPGINTGSGAASSLPAATGAPDKNYGLTSVAPKDNTPLPDAEKPADAPDQLNEAGKAPAGTPATDGKKNSDPLDKTDESSSKKKPKKGLDKINPF